MSLVENIWILTSVIIIFFVLSTDPKTASNSGSNNSQLGVGFSSIDRKQNSIRSFMWFAITCFYILSLVINYY